MKFYVGFMQKNYTICLHSTFFENYRENYFPHYVRSTFCLSPEEQPYHYVRFCIAYTSYAMEAKKWKNFIPNVQIP